MTYTTTPDGDGCTATIEGHTGGLSVRIHNSDETLLRNADAPRLALEILKAAGWVTTPGSIGGMLEAVALANEAAS